MLFFEIEPLRPDVLAESLAPCRTCSGTGDTGSVHRGQWTPGRDKAWLPAGPPGAGVGQQRTEQPLQGPAHACGVGTFCRGCRVTVSDVQKGESSGCSWPRCSEMAKLASDLWTGGGEPGPCPRDVPPPGCPQSRPLCMECSQHARRAPGAVQTPATEHVGTAGAQGPGGRPPHMLESRTWPGAHWGPYRLKSPGTRLRGAIFSWSGGAAWTGRVSGGLGGGEHAPSRASVSRRGGPTPRPRLRGPGRDCLRPQPASCRPLFLLQNANLAPCGADPDASWGTRGTRSRDPWGLWLGQGSRTRPHKPHSETTPSRASWQRAPGIAGGC